MWRSYLMLLWRVRKYNYGFTLIEMIVTVIIVGVIATIASPNLLGLLNRNRVNESMRQIEGALKEAQKQAIRSGRSCSITIDTANKIIANPTTAGVDGCLLSNRILNDLVQLNSSRATITFSGKGNISINDADPNLLTPVLVVSIPNGTDKQSCVVIQNALGSVRTGDYNGTIPVAPLPANCQQL